MKKKLVTLVLSGALILANAGGAMAAEKISCGSTDLNQLNSGRLQGVLQQCLSKYFDGAWGQKPELPESGESETQKPQQNETPGSGTVQQPSQNSGTQTAQVVSLVNQQRQKAGLESLKADSVLNRLAQQKAEDMAEKGYFSHTSPTYGSAFDMLKAAGYSYRTAGENIAMGQKTAETVMNGWMNSSGHRANILGSGYTKIGVGYAVNSSGTPYWVQIFAG